MTTQDTAPERGTVEEKILHVYRYQKVGVDVLAKEFGMTQREIRDILIESGLTMLQIQMRDKNAQRDADICTAYEEGSELQELSTDYGITEARVRQILTDRGVKMRRQRAKDRPPRSNCHIRLGQHLFDYIFDRGRTPEMAAKELNVSCKKLRALRDGTTEVDLLLWQDIATYTKTPMEKLLEVTFGEKH